MDYNKELEILVKSGSKVIEIVSFEWQRIQGFVNKVSDSLGYKWYVWSEISGLSVWGNNGLQQVNDELKDPIDVLTYFRELEEKAIFILEDFHPFLSDNNNSVIRFIRELTRSSDDKVLILATPIKTIPEELSKEMSIIEISLPGIETLKVIARKVINEVDIHSEVTDKLLSSALGLTVMEAEITFRKVINLRKQFTESEIDLVIAEKENVIKKTGLLEYYHPKDSLASIGGLDSLKEWVKIRENSFGKSAKDYGISLPKGLLLLGIPGCGKSLTAKVIARTWSFPLLRFDLGKVFGGIVGESEKNIRQALEISKALAPCVLWIDEIEKGLSGVQSSGATDGGTTSRVFGTFLTWLQEKEEPVFVVATANDISMLPPELLRKGRFDEIFFVDLPSNEERKNIFKIHIEKKHRDYSNFNLDSLVDESRGFTGAEIEVVVNDALFKAFSDGREVETLDIVECIQETSPLSKTMSENINKLRKWAKSRAKLASKTDAEPLSADSQDIPKLKQEMNNPFI